MKTELAGVPMAAQWLKPILGRMLGETETVERRRYERVVFPCKSELAVFPDGRPILALATNISVGGVGILTEAAFVPGEVVIVSFLLNNRNQDGAVDHVMGRVAYLNADVDANRVGVEFLERLHQSKHPELMRRLKRL